jgi:hypothetical protein
LRQANSSRVVRQTAVETGKHRETSTAHLIIVLEALDEGGVTEDALGVVPPCLGAEKDTHRLHDSHDQSGRLGERPDLNKVLFVKAS